jgi:hypothetical protein
MTSLEAAALRQRMVRVITRRAGASNGVGEVSEAARLTHDDLTAILAR